MSLRVIACRTKDCKRGYVFAKEDHYLAQLLWAKHQLTDHPGVVSGTIMGQIDEALGDSVSIWVNNNEYWVVTINTMKFIPEKAVLVSAKGLRQQPDPVSAIS